MLKNLMQFYAQFVDFLCCKNNYFPMLLKHCRHHFHWGMMRADIFPLAIFPADNGLTHQKSSLSVSLFYGKREHGPHNARSVCR